LQPRDQQRISMGNEISTFGGAVATVATATAAAVTFGQVEELNNAVVESANFTADKASKTIVRHAGETVINGAAAAATTAAVVVTLGQVDCSNEAMDECVDQTIESGAKTCTEVSTAANNLADNVPVVGHIKGAVHYAFDDKEGGDRAMKSASRTTGVIVGAGVGIAGGPAGMVAGGMAGGAVMDGITTGVESGIKGEYTPSGQIEAWTRVAQAKNSEELIGGIVDGVTAPVLDGMLGHAAGKTIKGPKSLLKKQPRHTYRSRGGSGSEHSRTLTPYPASG